MPQFGAPNTTPSFPSWANATILNRISRHPHPGTNRIDGRIVWPADSLQRSLASRQWGKLLWQQSQPPGDPPEYQNWENVWWDWTASGPAECFAWIDTTTSGRKALLRMRWYESLPTMGIPGTEAYYEAFVDDVSIGIRTIEMPDDTDNFEFNAKWPIVAPDAGLVLPPKTDPVGANEWFWIETNAISECWRWWNSQQTTECVYESDPNGMGSLAVTMDGWSWEQNGYGPLGELTEKQREFADKLNSRHICTPTYVRPGGYVPCEVQFQSDIMWDPEAQPFPLVVGAYYGFSFQVLFSDGVWRVFLHVRVWTRNLMTPTWEPWSSRSLSSGIFTLFGLNARLMNSIQFMPPPPYASRSADQYDFDATMFNVPPFGPFGLNDLGEGKCKVNELTPTERGIEPPLQGPLDMPREIKQVLALHDGSTGSVSGGVKMPIGSLPYDHGDWHPAGSPADALVVPAGVTLIRGIAQIDISAAGTAWTHLFRRNDAHPVASPAQTSLNEGIVAARSNIVLPPTVVVPGDEIGNYASSAGRNWDNDPFRTWLYLEAVLPQVEPFSATVIEHDEQIPAAATQIWMMKVPPSLNLYKLTHIGASLGSNKSPTADLQVALQWIRKAGRVVADITDDPIQIDADHWTSETSSAPVTILGTGEIATTGDIMVASIQQTAVNATGLIIDLELSEQQ